MSRPSSSLAIGEAEKRFNAIMAIGGSYPKMDIVTDIIHACQLHACSTAPFLYTCSIYTVQVKAHDIIANNVHFQFHNRCKTFVGIM